MAKEQMTFSLGIKTTADLEGINKLKSSLKELSTYTANTDFVKDAGLSSYQLGEATKSIRILGNALDSAFDVNLNGINFNQFQKNLAKSGTNLKEIGANLSKLGYEGQAAFAQTTAQVFKMNNAIKYTNKLSSKIFDTFKNTAMYTGFNAIFNTISSTLSKAVGYVEKLDTSLNNIRIVSGQTADQMQEFAAAANESAKALGTATTEYTDAALIYYQQGLDADEVAARTDVTVKMANATGESAQKISEDMTAIWNNFYDGSKSLEYYSDVITALGASTASSSSEIATGLEKFAAIGDTVGLSYEYATSALATVVAETRQSADTVGTAFKTIFARLQGLELGDTLDDGTNLNKYSKALSQVGISIKDSNGNLKEMDDILDEMGSKWQTLNKDQQVALAQTVAGTRQYTQLVALMDNWDTFGNNLETVANASGTLQKQQDIYMESTAAHLEKLGTAAEDLYSSLFDTKEINKWIDGFTKGVEVIDSLVESLGGLKNILPMIMAGITNSVSGQIANSISNVRMNNQIQNSMKNDESAKNEYLNQTGVSEISVGGAATTAEYQKQLEFMKQMNVHRQNMSKYEIDSYNNILEVGAELVKETAELERQQDMWSRNKNQLIKVSDLTNYETSINQLSEGVTKLKYLMVDVESAFANADNEDVSAVEIVTSSIELMEEELIEAGVDVDVLRTKFEIFKESKKGDLDEDSIKRFFSNAIQPSEELLNQTNKVSNALDIVDSKEKTLLESKNDSATVQDYVQMASAAAQLTTAFGMLTNVVEIWNNEDMSGSEKLLKIITSLGFMIPMLATSIKNLKLGTIIDSFKAGYTQDVVAFQEAQQAKEALALAESNYEKAILEQKEVLNALHKAKIEAQEKASYAKQEAEAALHAEKLVAIEEETQARIAVAKAQGDMITANALVEEATNSGTDIGKSAALEMQTEAVNNLNVAEINLANTESRLEALNQKEIVTEELLTGTKEAKTVATLQEAASQQAENVEKARSAVNSASVVAGETSEIAAKTVNVGVTGLLTKAWHGLNAAMKANPIGLVITGITLLIGAFKLLKEVIPSAENAAKAVEEDIEAFKDAKTELDDLNTKLDETKTRLEELYSINRQDLTISDKEEIARLEAQNKAIETQIKLQEQLLKQKAVEVAQDVRTSVDAGNYQTYEDNIDGGMIYSSGTGNNATAASIENAIGMNISDISMEDYNKYSEYIDAYESRIKELRLLEEQSPGQYTQDIKEAEAFLKNVTDAYQKQFDITKSTYEEAIISLDILKENNENGQYDDLINTLESKVASYYKMSGEFPQMVETAINDSLTNDKNGSAQDKLQLIKDNIDDIIDEQGNLDENALRGLIGENDLNTLKAWADGYNMSLQDIILGTEKYDVAIQQAAKTSEEFLADISSALSLTSDGINSLISGKEIENVEELENSLIGLTDQYEELISIRDKSSKEYINRLISIREELDKLAIDEAKNNYLEAYNSINKSNSIHTTYANGGTQQVGTKIAISAEASDAAEKLNDLVNADYDITIAVNADLNNDFDTLTGQMTKAAEMAGKISEEFIVAGSDLRELNQQFPGILDGIEYLADGTAKLNKEAVESALASAQLEKEADVEVTVQKLRDAQAEVQMKAETYRRMAEIAENAAKSDGDLTQYVTDLKAEAENLNAINSAKAATSEVEDEQNVAKESGDTGEAIVNNFTNAFSIASEASVKFAETATTALDAIKLNDFSILEESGVLDYDYTTLSSTYQRQNNDTNEGSDKLENGEINIDFDSLKDSDAFTVLADNLNSTADYYESLANDYEGAIAELVAGVSGMDELKSNNSSSSSKKKDLKYLDDEFDRYWDIKKALDIISNAMDRLDKKQSKLHGKELISSLKEENRLLEMQATQYKALAEEQGKELAELNKKLGDIGFIFDDEGRMQNYKAQTAQLLNDFNAVTEAYNAGTIDSDSYDAASKQYEQAKKLISRYDALIKEQRETQNDLDEVTRKAKENNLQAWEVELQLKLDTKEAERDWNDFYGKVNEDFKSIYKDYGNSFKVSLFDAKSLSSSFNDELQAIQDVKAEIDKMNAGGSSDKFESISDAQDKLKSLSEQWRDDAEKVFDLYEDGWDDFNSYIDEATGKMDKLNKKFERINDDLDHQSKLIKLLYGENDYNDLNSLYQAQENNLLGAMRSLRTQADFYAEEYKQMSSLYGEDSEAAQKFKEAWETALDDLHAKEETYLETLAEKYSNTLNKAFSDFEKRITNGSNLDWVSEQWDLQKEAAEDVYDEQERIYELQKLSNKYQESINKASTTKAQQKLQKVYESQVESLKEKEKLTKYDVELAEKRLAVAEAEAALEDARNAKNSMKVTRGEDGNWSYQYVADEDDIANKEQALADASSDVYEYVKTNVQETIEIMMKLATDYESKIKELQEKMIGATDEEKKQYQEQINWYESYYNKRVTELSKQLQEQQVDLAAETGALLQVQYNIDSNNYALMTEEQKSYIDGLREHSITCATDIYNASGETLSYISETGQQVANDTISYFDTAAAEIANSWINDSDSVQSSMTTALAVCDEAMKAYGEEVSAGCEAAGENFTNVGAAIDEDTKKTNELKDATDELVDEVKERIDEYNGYLENLEDLWNKVKDAVDANKDSIELYLGTVESAIEETADLINNINEATAAQNALNNARNGSGSGGNSDKDNNKNNNKNKEAVDFSVERDENGTFTIRNLETMNSLSGNRWFFYDYLMEDERYSESSFNYLMGAINSLNKNDSTIVKLPSNAIANLGFSTGGYTGEWQNGSEDGRLALLHQKELVLNESDTANILEAVDSVRSISNIGSVIQNAIAGAVAAALSGISGTSNIANGYITNNSNSSNNTYNINAPIQTSADVDEIKEAILSLPTLAAQRNLQK